MEKYVSSLVIALFLSSCLFAFANVNPILGLDEHDVGVANVTVDYAVMWYSAPSKINVTVANYGSYDEVVNVTVYMNATPIKEMDGIFTPGNSSVVLSFLAILWESDKDPLVLYGSYVLSAYVHPVPGETNTSNNMFTEGTAKVARYGDVNGDGIINLVDLILIASRLGKIPPFGYLWPIPFRIDTNNDGKINVLDLILVCRNLGM